MGLDSGQAAVRRNALLGLAIVVLCLGLAIVVGVHWPRLVEPTTAERIRYGLHWAMLPAFSLLMAIIRLGEYGFSYSDDRDGALTDEALAHRRVLRACLHNTLQQVVLAFIVYLVWAVIVPADWLPVIAASSGLFLFGRVLFFYGYYDGAAGRVLGFTLTFLPTLLMFVLSVFYVLFSYSYFYFT